MRTNDELILSAVFGLMLMVASPAGIAASPSELVRQIMPTVCDADWSASGSVLAGLELLEVEPLVVNEQVVGERSSWRDDNQNELRLVRVAPEGAMRRLQIEFGHRQAGNMQPGISVLLDAECAIRDARRILYSSDGVAERIQRLDTDIDTVLADEPLDEPVPPGSMSPGVPVAMVDSGVNYTLAAIGSRLARNESGQLIGFDFWDLDERPFDASPARSPFFPQRHGTQTASLMLSEAPVARVAPYRYPRPDMSRMGELLLHAAAHGVRIVNVSLGSNRLEDWSEFERVARGQPEMLIVVSAGNDGRDLDVEPTYPAALRLDNLISVTSLDDFGRPAPGSNWGRSTVDIGVPAENMIVTDFHGRAKLASGSSYAAARISALAACLLAANPSWNAPELKRAIFARASGDTRGANAQLAVGMLDDPDQVDRGACAAARSEPELLPLREHALDEPASRLSYGLSLGLVLLTESGWSPEQVPPMLRTAAAVLAQCGIALVRAQTQPVAVPEPLKYFTPFAAHQLVRVHRFEPVTVYLLKDTLREDAYDAEAIGESNSRGRSELKNTVWMTRGIDPPEVSLVHELIHVLMDSGEHVDDANNLMYPQSSEQRTALTAGQCQRVRDKGVEGGLLFRR